ncbi:MAG TPA: RagB/SusD family nutrient uptake outer membrane protein [Flavobacteriaceae bacterium]
MLSLLISCNPFLDVGAPVSETDRETIFEDNQSATAAVIGIYSEMMSTTSFANSAISYNGALSADEINLLNQLAGQNQFLNNNLLPTNNDILSSFWEPGFRLIWYANSAVDGITSSSMLSEDVRNQLLGELLFIRAFCHFYLTGFFGDIPYVTSSDYHKNAVINKISQSQVYDHIIQDLNDAKELLSEDYPSPNRTRPNKSVASTLLARVYLYTEQWQKAIEESDEILGSAGFILEPDLNNVFLYTSKETIWQLIPVFPGHNTEYGIFVTNGSNGALKLRDELVTSFDNGDNRMNSWVSSRYNASSGITTYYPFKYKEASLNRPLTEYNIVFRLAELYLIRAEARAMLGILTGVESAASDLAIIRERAGLNPIISSNQTELLEAITKERRVELFTEWGHRWFDLKRLGIANNVLSPIKHNWQSTDVLYPIPQIELDRNNNLLPQNEGY